MGNELLLSQLSFTRIVPSKSAEFQGTDGYRKQRSSSSSSTLNQSVTVYRGSCPLTRHGIFGILPTHNIRCCEGKPSCLYHHFQSYHHMTARSSYKVCKAILKQRDPTLTVLFSSEDVLYNKSFHIACPFNQDEKNPFDCQPKYILKAPCSSIISRLDMPRHLRDVHRVQRTPALKIVAEMRRCSKDSNTAAPVKLNRNLFPKQDTIVVVGDGKKASQVTDNDRSSLHPSPPLSLSLSR